MEQAEQADALSATSSKKEAEWLIDDPAAKAAHRRMPSDDEYVFDGEIDASLARHAANKRIKCDDAREEGEVKGDNKQGSEAEEEEKAEAKKEQRSEEGESARTQCGDGDHGAERAEDGHEAGTGTIRVIRTQVYEDLLTLDEFQKLAGEERNSNRTHKIEMNKSVVIYIPPQDPRNGGHEVEVTKYVVLSTTVTEQEISVADMTMQDLINNVYPGDPNPPKKINIFMDHGVGPPFGAP